MHLIQILLPVPDAGTAAAYRRIRDELTERFGGVTAFTGSPAEGLWERGSGDVERDTIVLVEVMTESIDMAWWSSYRRELEGRLSQEKIVIRALAMRVI